MKRLLPFIVFILLIIGALIAVPVILNPERHRAEITDAASKAVKRPVVIGPLSMTYWPPTLHMNAVAIMKSSGEPMIQIDSAAAPLDWSSLFQLKFLPTSLQLIHPSMTISRNADGHWDLPDFLSGMGPASGHIGNFQQIGWTQGEIHFVDRFGSSPQDLILGSLEGHWDLAPSTLHTTGAFNGLGATAQLTLDASGKFSSPPDWSAEVQLSDQGNTWKGHLQDKGDVADVLGGAVSWKLVNALSFLKFYSRGASNSIDYSVPILLDHWQVHARHDATGLRFEHSAGIAGGVTEASGTITSSPTGPMAHVSGAAKDVPAKTLVVLLGEPISLDGKLTAIAKNVEVTFSSQTLSSLAGDGYLQLTDGQYKLPEISVKNITKARTTAYLRKKYPTLETDGIPVTKASFHWQAKNGLVSIDDGFVASPDLKAGWVGKVDAARQGLDGYLILQIREKDPKLAHLIPEKYRTRPATGRLQGTWQEWSLRQTIKIPAGVLSKLRKAVNQK